MPGADQRGLLDRLGERERRVVVEQPGVQVRVADHDHVVQARGLARLEPQPQPVGVRQLDRLGDVRRLEPDRLERPATEPPCPRAATRRT